MKSKSWRTFISIPAVLAILICQLSLVYSHVFAEPASTSKSVFNAKEEYSDTQGEIWQYKSRDIVSNTYTDMTYSDGVWSGNGASIRLDASGNMYMTARDGAYQAVLEFVAPYSGTIDIYGHWYSSRTETRHFNIWNGTTPLMDPLIVTAAGSSEYSVTSVSVKQGDRIRFLVAAEGNTDAPLYIGMADTPVTIAYSEVKSSDATLSSLTASGITFNEPFSPATTTYTATVETSVTSTTLAATAADAKASIAEGALGEKALKMGLNTLMAATLPL